MLAIKKRFLFGLLLCVSGFCFAQNSPVPMLENTAQQILQVLKKNQQQLKSNHQLIFQTVERYLLPQVDVEGMSRSVLGRQAWNAASASQRREFSKVFTQLVIRTYANPLAEYTSETITFMPIRGQLSSRFVRVNSIISRPNGQRIPLNYSLVDKNGQWKIYDLSVEGVSLLQSFHNQFAGILKTTDINALIVEMKNHHSAG